MRQENVYVLHHECEEIKFFGRKMNFVIATPEQVTLQIQLQISDLNHARNPRCTQAWSPENLSHSCCKPTRNLLCQFFRYRECVSLSSEESKQLRRHVLEQVSRRRVSELPKRLGHGFDLPRSCCESWGWQNLSNSFMEGSFANPRFVRIPSLLPIKPDPSGRNNWTKVSAILWYKFMQRVALDGPRWHSAVLEVGPRQRAPIAPGRSRQCIHQPQLVDPVLYRKPCLLWTEHSVTALRKAL